MSSLRYPEDELGEFNITHVVELFKFGMILKIKGEVQMRKDLRWIKWGFGYLRGYLRK